MIEPTEEYFHYLKINWLFCFSYNLLLVSVNDLGNSVDKLCHTRSVAYLVELVLLNKHQISGGGAKLHCYHDLNNTDVTCCNSATQFFRLTATISTIS